MSLRGSSLDALEQAFLRSLAAGLPGPEAQLPMAPRPRPGWTPGRSPEGSRPGAGLVLFHSHGGKPCLVLTVRARHLPSHRGQVSFPGGAIEPGESVAEAALREAREEISADSSRVRIAGELTPLHIPASGFVLHPVVGFAPGTLEIEPSAGEVERILEIPFEELCDPGRVRTETRSLLGNPCEVPFFDLAGEKVWGATAMVLSELLWLLGAPCDPWG